METLLAFLSAYTTPIVGADELDMHAYACASFTLALVSLVVPVYPP